MITSFLALEPTIQRHGRLSIGLSLKFNFIARQQEGLLTKALQQLAWTWREKRENGKRAI